LQRFDQLTEGRMPDNSVPCLAIVRGSHRRCGHRRGADRPRTSPDRRTSGARRTTVDQVLARRTAEGLEVGGAKDAELKAEIERILDILLNLQIKSIG
jgi:hypothetical protein